MDSPLSGSAICAVDGDGRLMLVPSFVRALRRRSEGDLLVIGVHETDPCLTLAEPVEIRRVQADFERHWIDVGGMQGARNSRARRMFGFAEEASLSSNGKVRLPLLMRRRAAIADIALVVGTGSRLEVWDPDTALASEDPVVRELAELNLALAEAA